MDDRAAHVWAWFVEMDARRGNTGFGPLPISYSEIEAFQRLTGERMSPWEVRALVAVDDAILSEVAEQARREA